MYTAGLLGLWDCRSIGGDSGGLCQNQRAKDQIPAKPAFRQPKEDDSSASHDLQVEPWHCTSLLVVLLILSLAVNRFSLESESAAQCSPNTVLSLLSLLRQPQDDNWPGVQQRSLQVFLKGL